MFLKIIFIFSVLFLIILYNYFLKIVLKKEKTTKKILFKRDVE